MLGFHSSSSVAPGIQAPDGAVALERVPADASRDIGRELRQRLAVSCFVLLVGDSSAGKSRAAYEAISALRDYVIIVPQDRDAVATAVEKAAAARQVEVLGLAPDDAMPFGVQIIVHATARGPRRAVAISESLVDGIIAAFHAGASAVGAAAAAAALAPRLPGMKETEIAALAAMGSPGPICATSPFVIKGSYVQISPCDERCHAGQVTIKPDAEGQFPQISGELFTLRRRES